MSTTAENPITEESLEPPPAPTRVPAPPSPPGAQPSPATDAGPTRPRFRLPQRPPTPGRRRTRVEVRHVGPLSVLKFSLLFYFCAMLIAFIALFLIFQVLEASGTIDTLETDVLGCLFQPSDVERPTTGECIPYDIDGGVVFTWLFLAGIAGTLLVALLNTFIAVVYNLISDIVGGVEVTLSEGARRP